MFRLGNLRGRGDTKLTPNPGITRENKVRVHEGEGPIITARKIFLLGW